ncbi:IclR family transcriptional regulator [Sphingobium nicotianae]|uniref:IclR family transcriptional regulator n=1 Tax=Sphingobium nicotianae TaxID=2782607 RepID=A0A9X1IRC9_9SPHN|nr:IclR family transcriptional regulator [Sphingobium nicotianae]MBT2187336.1 IclR family transcriptional regulator [Sphingobium nicotianae]
MAKQTAAEPAQRRVQSIEVGFRVLRVLRMAEGPLPLREIAARSNMPPSKVHLYLVSFVRENVAYQDVKTGHYGLGSFAIQLGLAAIRQIDVVSLAADTLTSLRDQTDCAIYLSLWGDRGPCIVAKADGALQGAFAVRLGYILPLTSTATGLVFLAYLPDTETEEALGAQAAFEAAGKRGGGASRQETAESLAKEIARVRQHGFASTVGRLHRNFSGISAPIFDYSGRIAAALTLLGPTDFMTGERQRGFSSLLLEATNSLSQRLGAPGAAAESSEAA